MKAILLAILLAFGVSAARADQLITSYIARLSKRDHYNSAGERLTTPAAVIRQDRANFHKFHLRDPRDEDDSFFADENHRSMLESALEHGHASPEAFRAILNSNPLVRVSVYRSGGDFYVDVEIVHEGKGRDLGTRAVGFGRCLAARKQLCDGDSVPSAGGA